jgi:hypothetical protein
LFPLFANGVVDTGGKFATVIFSTTPAVLVTKSSAGVIDTGVKGTIRKTLMLFSWALRKMIHEKNLKQTIS